MLDSITAKLQDFEPLEVSQLSRVALLSRKDTKYLLPLGQLVEVLHELSPYYSVLTIKERRIFQYNTTYYDTEEFDLYNMHQNGKLNRLKVRARSYTESNLHFNEIKQKRNTGNTDKARITRSEAVDSIDVTFEAFIEENTSLPSKELTNKTGVNFKRITLVDKEFTERLTIDVHLEAIREEKRESFNNLVIIELKQDRDSNSSKATQLLRDMRIFKQGCSKYCLAVSTLYDNVKKNQIKKLQRTVDRIQKGTRSIWAL